MYYEIEYVYRGNLYTATVRPVKGYEERFCKDCLDRIESITSAGAHITSTQMHTK